VGLCGGVNTVRITTTPHGEEARLLRMRSFV
jgi:hypothetical protein